MMEKQHKAYENNVLVAYENIHYLKREKGKTGACAVKLDKAKAYDRVEWSYLHRVMLKLGFNLNLVRLSVRVKEHLSNVFLPTR